jgi:hypothetical protein
MNTTPTVARGRDEILPMSVGQMAFLVDRLYQDCSPLQFLRELTKNAIEGVIRRVGAGGGEIRWDVDWNRFKLTTGHVTKLCIIDNGCGMTGPEMVEYINKLSSSIHQQSKTGNFGVGAKISTAPANPEGIVYLSWVAGKGSMIHLYRDAKNGIYGLRRFENGEFWQAISNDIKPEPIEDHGTMVVLLGDDEAQDTMRAPSKAKMARKWVLRYLNERFFRFPKNVAVKAREGWDLDRGDKHNFLRTVTGMEDWLSTSSQARGSVRLAQAKSTAHWWIIKSGVDLNSGHYPPGGHVAALYQDELYQVAYGTAGYARLQAFGVIFGCDRVVIYVEPDNGQKQDVTSNTARTLLLIDNEPLNWSEHAAEFRENMPDELDAFQNEIGQNAQHSDHRLAIRDRLKSIKELFKFGRYRPAKAGKFSVGDPAENTGGTADEDGTNTDGKSTRGGATGGRRGDIYALFTEEGGRPADLVESPIEPERSWISVEDGSRAVGDLEDRAARYIPESNRLLINGDFRAFTDMVDRWVAKYEAPGTQVMVIRDVVREWFEQQLVETILSAWALRHTGRWSMVELPELWSEAALTAAVLPRYHIDVNIKRTLGQRLGKLATAA